MQDILSAILLGIIEGLTEFLPVSSTGHLLIAQELLGFETPGAVFPIVIQFGAILSVVVVYWQRFWTAFVGLPNSQEARHFALSILAAFIPAMVIGALLHSFIKEVLFSADIAPMVIAISLILGGVLILVLERMAPKARFFDGDKLPLGKAFQIGLCQAVAIIPGVSRSGATILGGQLLGVDRKAAALFTFYLAVPTMFGATVYDIYKNRDALDASAGIDIAVGFVVSFLVAYVVVKRFIDFIGRYGLAPFGWYRIVAGTLILGVLLLR